MNKKISKILGVGLTIVMLASLLIMATPASASTLAWGEETTTKNLKDTALSTIRAPAGTDIVDLAVSGTTVYAAAQAATNNVTYKSTDGGATWSSLYYTTDYPQGKVPKLVAVASDDANTVVMVTTENKVYYSSNGGSSWTYLENTAAPTINAVDVSSGTTRYIAAAGATSGGVAELYILKVAMAEAWAARYSTTDGARAQQTAIYAVKLSPNFTSDKIVNVVSGNATNETWLQAFRNETGALKWNNDITSFTDWAEGIQLTDDAAATGIHLLAGGPAAADVAFLATYRGSDSTARDAFVAVAGVTSGGGVTRLGDVYPTTMSQYSGAAIGAIGSLAYHSSGKLLAGSYATTNVYRFLDPMAATPKASSLTTLKQPGGVSLAQVAWVGDNAVAGTSGNESAFAVSTDSGKTYNDVSLIDTAITTMSDVALNAAGSKMYITTNDGADTSVWVKLTAWQRIFSEQSEATKHLVRIAPDNDAVVYVADQGTQDMWVSKDSGTTWSYIPNYKVTAIQDFVVQSADVVYAIDTVGLTKTTDAGGSWGDKKSPTDTFTAYSVTLATNSANTSDVLIGGSGYVAYSKDGGATVTRTTATTAGNVQVVADASYATNNVIYVGVATAVQRGKADATTAFASRSPTFTTDYTSPVIKGIARDGAIIYALSSNGTDSALSRALNLTSTVASATDALWSTAITTYELEATPSALRLTTGGVLWAIDTGNTLVSFTDGLSAGAVTLNTPALAYQIPINTTTGLAYDTTFTWTRQNTSVTGTVLEIATEAAFTSIIYTNTLTGIATDIVSRVIGPSGSTDDTGAKANFMPGTTYYWRVRASLPLRSVWSETRTLTVGAVTPAATTISLTVPAAGAIDRVVTNLPFTWVSVAEATGYTVVISASADLSSPVVTANTTGTAYTYTGTLGYSTPYYWRVEALKGTASLVKSDVATFVTAARPAVVVVPPVVPPTAVSIVSPAVGATNVSLNPILTWTKYETAIGYEVALGTDSTFAIKDYSHNVPVANTFYSSETLSYATTYYWRVRGVTGASTKVGTAAPGGAWATGAFTTMAEPVEVVAAEPAAPTIIVQKEPGEIKIVEVPVQTVVPQPIPSYLLWIIIVIGAVLLIALIVLIARTRRVA